MKQLICMLLMVFALFLTGLSPVWSAPVAYGYAPQTYKNGLTYGNGIYFAPYRFTVYTEANEASSIVGEFRWGTKTQSNQLDFTRANGDHITVAADRVFFSFFPELSVAMMAVTGDEDENGWIEVIYDQAQHKTGWVHLQPSLKATDPKLAHLGTYQTWLEFMKLNARAHGIYWLTGVTEYQRSLRSSDEDSAKIIPITIIRELKVRHVRGNWLLVEVLDFERNMPIGWVRWRDDDGNLMVFPNVSGQHLPIVTTVY